MSLSAILLGLSVSLLILAIINTCVFFYLCFKELKREITAEEIRAIFDKCRKG